MKKYLAHYGVKGMRWGIRRYQPYSQTGSRKNRKAAFKKVPESDIKKMLKYVTLEDNRSFSKTRENNKKEAGVISGQNGIDTIKKGSKFQRITGGEETVDDKRKYVSITTHDNRAYSEVSDALDFDYSNKIYYDEYEAKYDLKVAGEKAVEYYIKDRFKDVPLKDLVTEKQVGEFALQKYGDVKMKDLYYDDNRSLVFNDPGRYTESNRNKSLNDNLVGRTEYDLYRALREGNRAVRRQLSTDKKFQAETIDYFKKKGMDAIVDYEDSWGFDYPLILLNPKKSVKRTEHYTYE